jgi:hypothetical protein
MRVRETDDRRVVILITRAILIRIFIVNAANVVRLLIGVGRELDGAERYCRTRKRVAHLVCSDERVDVAIVVDGALSSYDRIDR